MRMPVLLTVALLPSAALAAGGSWPSAGNGLENTRSTGAETVLSPKTVAGLRPIWTLKTRHDVPDTPTVEGNAAYAVDNGSGLYRLDVATGKIVWSETLAALSGNAKSFARTSPAIGPASIVIGDQGEATVYALDKSSGKLLWRTTLDHAIGAIITSLPVIAGSTVVVGVSSNQEEYAAQYKNFELTFRGSVAALDLATGRVLWQVHTVPTGFTGAAVWGSNLAVDQSRHAVYAGTGDNYSVPDEVAECQAKARNGRQQDACLPVADHIDSVLSLDLKTGRELWARRFTPLDTWTVSCIASRKKAGTPCPQPQGPDWDFGSAPNLFSAVVKGTKTDLVGAGQKSGVYWALNRDTGATVWATQVNPPGTRGGIEWGSAIDGHRIFVAASNSAYTWTSILGSNQVTNGGFWSALDTATGRILWQTMTTAKQPKAAKNNGRTIMPPPGARARTEGAVTAANGVLYGADEAGNFFALDEASGAVLWKYASGGAAVDGPSIVNGMLLWGDGYGNIGPSNPKIYAFGLGK